MRRAITCVYWEPKSRMTICSVMKMRGKVFTAFPGVGERKIVLSRGRHFQGALATSPGNEVLEPAPGCFHSAIDAYIAQREPVFPGEFQFVAAVTRGKTDERVFLSIRLPNHDGVDKPIANRKVGVGQFDDSPGENQPWAVAELEFTACGLEQPAATANWSALELFRRKGPVLDSFHLAAGAAEGQKIPGIDSAKDRQPERPAGDEPRDNNDRDRKDRAGPWIDHGDEREQRER